METVVIYSRVSTTMQHYEGQTLELKRYAEYKKYKIKRIFEEKFSGYDDEKEREQFSEMKKYVVDNKINHILCWELSRFSRRTYITLTEIRFFTKHNVNVHFHKENIDSLSDQAFNKVLLSLMASIAEMDRETRVQYHRRGMLRGASQGKAHGLGVLPYGYKKSDSGDLKINEEEASIVRLIYNLRIEGKGTGTIANELNKRGIETHHAKLGKRRELANGEEIDIVWRQNTIRRILQSTVYKGKRTYFGITFEVPQIIESATWNNVQSTFADKIGYINRTEFKYLFKGKIRCGKCGLAYLSRTDLKSGSTKDNLLGWNSYYFCSGRKDKGIRCHNGQFKAATLDKLVWIMLASMVEFREQILKDRVNINPEESKKTIEYLNKEIGRSENRKRRVITVFQDGFLTDDEYRNEMSKITSDIAEWTNEIKQLKNEIKKQTKSVRELSKMKTQNIRWMPFTKRRQFVEKYVDKVVLTQYDGKIEGTHGNDQIMKCDLFAFGLNSSKSAIISSVSEIFNVLPS
jgi:site-specific DNA recombinase